MSSFGLLSQEGNAIPLVSIVAHVQLVDFVAKVTLEQKYKNNKDNPIEATYNFPIDERSAVTGFEAVTSDKSIKAIIQESEKAKDTYEEAISSGHGAFLLENTKDNIFTMSLGNILPQQEITIKIYYITQLTTSRDTNDPDVSFTIPTTLVSQYTPIMSSHQDTTTVSLSHSSAVTYTFNCFVHVLFSNPIQKINCLTHKTDTRFFNSKTEADISISKNDTHNVSDGFKLSCILRDPHQPRLWTQLDSDKNISAMFVLYPKFDVPEVNTEIIFLVDQSGSMGGESIKEARKALKTCLEILPKTVLFNVIGFGSGFVSVFPQSKPSEKQYLTKALNYAKSMDATLGGTEILAPLEDIYSKPVRRATPRNIFLLTDGGVSNTEKVKQLVQNNSHNTRVFSFGIGSGVSQELVNGVARLGKGRAVFIDKVANMKGIVSSQLKCALQSALTEVSIDFGHTECDWHVPHRLPPIFNSEQYVVFAYFSKDKLDDVTSLGVNLNAIGPDAKPIKYSCNVTPTTSLPDNLGDGFIQQLAAKIMIQELEEGELSEKDSPEKRKERIIELGLKYCLASKHTSFVAVDTRESNIQQQAMESIEVPLPIPNPLAKSSHKKKVQYGGRGRCCKRLYNNTYRRLSSRYSNQKSIITKTKNALKSKRNLKQASQVRSARKCKLKSIVALDSTRLTKSLATSNSHNATNEKNKNGVDTLDSKIKLGSKRKHDNSNSMDLTESVSNIDCQNSYQLTRLRTRLTIDSAIGIPLFKPTCSISDPCISYVLSGPKNDSSSISCWLNSSLAFLLCIKPIRDALFSLSSQLYHNNTCLSEDSNLNSLLVSDKLIESIACLIHIWCETNNCTKKWRRDLTESFNKLKPILEINGFNFNKEMSPLVCINFILCRLNSLFKISQCIIINSIQEFYDFKLTTSTYEYVICNSNNRLPTIPKGWSLLACMHYESLPVLAKPDEFSGHFSVYCFDNSKEGYVVYNSILGISPGNYQGGFVSSDYHSYNEFLTEVFDNVSLFVIVKNNMLEYRLVS